MRQKEKVRERESERKRERERKRKRKRKRERKRARERERERNQSLCGGGFAIVCFGIISTKGRLQNRHILQRCSGAISDTPPPRNLSPFSLSVDFIETCLSLTFPRHPSLSLSLSLPLSLSLHSISIHASIPANKHTLRADLV